MAESIAHDAILHGIIESSEDAIIGESLDGIIILWNPGAERTFGYTAAEAIGQPSDLIVPPEKKAESQQSGGRIDHFETMRRRKDGTMIPISLTVSPIYDQTGRIIGASKIARDLSALRTYATTLEDTVRHNEVT